MTETDFYSRGSTFRSLTALHQGCDHIPFIQSSIPLADLRQQWQGKSCWCLAGGPSLDRRLDLILQTQDDCLILAADVVATRLQKAGVRLDMVVTLDRHMQDWVSTDFGSETVLAGSLTAVPKIMGETSKRLYLLPEDIANRYGFPENHVTLGSNVGVSLISLAAALGAAEVLVGGLDLATEGEYYSNLVENFQEKTDHIRDFVAGLDAFVMGNSGKNLVTNTYFATSINEVHLLHDERLPLYNPNINDGIGAQLPHARPLPENWRPIPSAKADKNIKTTEICTEDNQAARQSLSHLRSHTESDIHRLFEEVREQGFAHPLLSSSDGSLPQGIIYEAAVGLTMPLMLAQFDSDEALLATLADEQQRALGDWQGYLGALPQPRAESSEEAPAAGQELRAAVGQRLPQRSDQWRGCLLVLLTRRWLNLQLQRPEFVPPLLADPLDNLTVLWESHGHIKAEWQHEALAWAGLRQPQQWAEWVATMQQRPGFAGGRYGALFQQMPQLVPDDWHRLWRGDDHRSQLALLCDWQLHPERANWLEQLLAAGTELPARLYSSYLTQHPDPQQALQRLTPQISAGSLSLPAALAVAHARPSTGKHRPPRRCCRRCHAGIAITTKC